MLRQNKKVIAIRQFLRSIYTIKLDASWSKGIRDRISSIFGVSENNIAPAVSDDTQESTTMRPSQPPRFIVFSDTDNDLESVKSTLYFAGILDQKSRIEESIHGTTILHTGDLTDKKNPDLSVVEYWRLLQQDVLRKGGKVRLIAGNHEQKIWQRIHAGRNYGLNDDQAHDLKNFIENLDLFYVAGPILFIHGYPTLEFLEALAHFKDVTGKDLNSFNDDHYRKSFRSVRAMKQYAYVRENRKIHHLLYDVVNASDYYKEKGRIIGTILEKLKICVVVHGHKPQHSGTQADYEFSKWIPNIRMVGNDTNVSQRGIGATVIRPTSTEALDVVFINSKTASDELRREVQEILGQPFESSQNTPGPNTAVTADRSHNA